MTPAARPPRPDARRLPRLRHHARDPARGRAGVPAHRDRHASSTRCIGRLARAVDRRRTLEEHLPAASRARRATAMSRSSTSCARRIKLVLWSIGARGALGAARVPADRHRVRWAPSSRSTSRAPVAVLFVASVVALTVCLLSSCARCSSPPFSAAPDAAALTRPPRRPQEGHRGREVARARAAISSSGEPRRRSRVGTGAHRAFGDVEPDEERRSTGRCSAGRAARP